MDVQPLHPSLLTVDDRPLVLLGTGASQRHAPWTEIDCAFWGKSYMIGQVPRLNVAFEIHSAPKCLDAGHLGSVHVPIEIPVIMQRTWPQYPTSMAYPIEAVTRELAIPGRALPFLTSTPAYMLALVLLQKVQPRELRLFGIDMAQTFEYRQQLRACEFLLGMLHGRGVKIVLPAGSDLLRTNFRYGYDERPRDQRVVELEDRLEHVRQERDRALVDEQLARRRQHNAEAVIESIVDDIERAKA